MKHARRLFTIAHTAVGKKAPQDFGERLKSILRRRKTAKKKGGDERPAGRDHWKGRKRKKG